MRVVRAAGVNVSPSDDGRLFNHIFSDGLFEDTTITISGTTQIALGAMYGVMRGRDFTVEATTIDPTLPPDATSVTGYVYIEFDTTATPIISIGTALSPFTVTYENINTNGAVCQMIIAEYVANSVAISSVTPVYKIAQGSSTLAGSIATIEEATAVANHAVGEFIVYNGQLYEVTSAITIGDTLTVGTNITATTVGAELKTLNDGLNIKTVTGTDGTAIKFPDGTMFVYGLKTVSLSTSMTTVHFAFPVPFVGGGQVVTISTGAGGTRTEAFVEDLNSNGFNAFFEARSIASSSWFRYIAIGRWK